MWGMGIDPTRVGVTLCVTGPLVKVTHSLTETSFIINIFTHHKNQLSFGAVRSCQDGSEDGGAFYSHPHYRGSW